MWWDLRKSEQTDPDFVESARELLQSTSLVLIVLTGAFATVLCFAATVTWPGRTAQSYVFLAAILLVSLIVALRLSSSRQLAGCVVLLLGMLVAITVGIWRFQRYEISVFYVLLPLIAVVVLGWPFAIVAEGLILVLAWWLSTTSVTRPFSSHLLHILVVSAGAVAGLVGWLVTRALMTMMRWSLESYEQARQKMEEARDQSVQLQQTQEDLVKANKELSRVSERLKAMHLVAEEARRAKEEFVANVSHELRTPLNMIIGFSEMIVESPSVYGERALPPLLLSDIEAIYQNSQQLSRLVNDVLDLSQLEAGRLALTKDWVSISQIVDAAAVAVRALFEAKGLYLRTDVPSDLPKVYCDETRVRQVILNLLSNAGRFTEKGGVWVRAKCDSDGIVVSVADTGPGIPSGMADRIFEPFKQLDGSIRRRHGGSGLGLSISKQFVEMHGGDMWFESEVGAGSTFFFRLPIETPVPSSVENKGVARAFNPMYEYRARTGRPRLPRAPVPPRLVVLEQGNALQRLLQRCLEGYEVACVDTAQAAVDELTRSPARALVVNAPPTGEMEAWLGELEDVPYDTPVITCWIPGVDERARQLGVLRYLVKPVMRETLLEAVRESGKTVETVLLVDDQTDALQLFTRVLATSDEHYRVLRARTGQRALSLMRERRPDVVLLDLIMPGMDGFEVLVQKSRDPDIRDIPVIIISSRDPAGEPVVSDRLGVRCDRGLSVLDLVDCIQALSGILSPSARSVRQER